MEIEIIFLKVESKKGVSLDEMDSRIAPLESTINSLGDEILDSYQTRVGIQQESDMDSVLKRGKHYAQLNIYLTPANSRTSSANEVIHYLQKKTDEQNKVLYANYGNYYENKNSLAYASYNNGIFFRKVQKGKISNAINIPIEKYFIYGGGFISSDEFVYYSSSHELRKYNIKTKESVFIKKFEKDNKLAEVLFFYIFPNSSVGLLALDDGMLYSINLQNGSKEPVSMFSKLKIMDILVLENKEYFVILDESGKLNIYSYAKNSIKHVKTVKESIYKKNNFGRLLSLSTMYNSSSSIGASATQFLVTWSNGFVSVIDFERNKLEDTIELVPLKSGEILYKAQSFVEDTDKWFLSTNLGLYVYSIRRKESSFFYTNYF